MSVDYRGILSVFIKYKPLKFKQNLQALSKYYFDIIKVK